MSMFSICPGCGSDWCVGCECVRRSPETIARIVHAGQKERSTGDPYIQHIERVVALVSDEAKPVAWLHDVLEDTSLTVAGLLELGIDKATVERVSVVSHLKARDTYNQYIDLVMNRGDSIVLEVKEADLVDHLRPNCPADLRPRYERALPLIRAARRRLNQ